MGRRGDWIKPFCFTLMVVVAQPTDPLIADLIPPGKRGVTHYLVFVDSPLLQSHRLIATPVRGFGGFEDIQAGRPFRFSSKYGTRLYVVPSDFVPPEQVGPGKLLPFPSCEVPVRSITFVPKFSPVKSLRSTCKLVEVGDEVIRVELIDHVELGSRGEPVSASRSVVPLLLIATIGLLGCLAIWRRSRAKTDGAEQVIRSGR